MRVEAVSGTDAHVADLLALYHLDALDRHSGEHVARHLQSCQQCRAAATEVCDTLAALALLDDDRDQLLNLYGALGAAVPPAFPARFAPQEPADPPRREAPETDRRRFRLRRGGTGAEPAPGETPAAAKPDRGHRQPTRQRVAPPPAPPSTAAPSPTTSPSAKPPLAAPPPAAPSPTTSPPTAPIATSPPTAPTPPAAASTAASTAAWAPAARPSGTPATTSSPTRSSPAAPSSAAPPSRTPPPVAPPTTANPPVAPPSTANPPVVPRPTAPPPVAPSPNALVHERPSRPQRAEPPAVPSAEPATRRAAARARPDVGRPPQVRRPDGDRRAESAAKPLLPRRAATFAGLGALLVGTLTVAGVSARALLTPPAPAVRTPTVRTAVAAAIDLDSGANLSVSVTEESDRVTVRATLSGLTNGAGYRLYGYTFDGRQRPLVNWTGRAGVQELDGELPVSITDLSHFAVTRGTRVVVTAYLPREPGTAATPDR